jgi:hypothetical protein
MRLPFSRLFAGVVIVVAVAALLFAGRIGSSVGTKSDSTNSALSTKACPTGSPNDCRDLFASAIHLAATRLPTIATEIPGLTFTGGQIISPKDGTTPLLELDYHSTTPARTLHLLVRQHQVPTSDVRTIRTTAGGHKYREVRASLGTVGLTFFDENFSYVLVDEFSALLTKSDGLLPLAENLVDAISPSTRRLDPK